MSTSYNTTNPELEYGIVCNEDLVYKLTEKSAELVNQFSPSLKQWTTPPSHDPKSTKIDKSLAFTLNSLKMMLSFELDKDLNDIVAERSEKEVMFELVEVAEDEGWIKDLVCAASRYVPRNPDLRVFIHNFFECI